ncbi:MAG TPA: EAL domain-containing protein [Caldimonas sp.]|jgi:hypothetical protein|nr:EAL domain-containing protein [Caldimonas sp.]HEX4235707.1 EAL domain-containing protein [Caldimonas sp.]
MDLLVPLLARARIGVRDMQAHSTREPYILLEYQSNEPRVFGVEVRPREARGFQGVIAALRWLGRSKAFINELTFVVMALPRRAQIHEIQQIARCASAEGLVNKLCLVAPPRAGSTIFQELRHAGIRTLLSGVGSNSRFSDIADHCIDGIVIEPGLLSNAAGDPGAASILDAIVALSANLGIKSFANDCVSQSEFDFATSAGITYVTFGRPYLDKPTSRTTARPRSTFRAAGDSMLS